MWRLLVPLRYLRIRHSEKVKFDLIFPIVFMLLVTLPLALESFLSDAMSAVGILDRSSDLLSIMTGFFVAALAAVSTFGNPEMDEDMAGSEPVTLKDAAGNSVPLSRRRFLSYLFGYLALASIIIYGLGFLFLGIQRYIVGSFAPEWSTVTFIGFWMLYAFALGNLLANSLLGLFYLTDRIHRPNRTITFRRPPAEEAEKKVA